jgi:hypothetical protein
MPVPARYLLAFTGGLVCLDRPGRSFRLRWLWRDLDGCDAGLCLRPGRECRQSVRLCERQPVLLNHGRGCSPASNYRSRSNTSPQRKQCAQEQQTNKGEPNRSEHRNHLAVPAHSQAGARFRALKRLSAVPYRAWVAGAAGRHWQKLRKREKKRLRRAASASMLLSGGDFACHQRSGLQLRAVVATSFSAA